MKFPNLFLSCILLALSLGACKDKTDLSLPSPAWEDQVLYFIMTDRFSDGDPSNNDQGMGEYDLAKEGWFHGGDLKGVQQNIPYLKGLGVTGLWLTPQVKNQWFNPDSTFTGYHGYWASHMMEVDPHFGTLADYTGLSAQLHNEGMYLIQDVVTNHMGNYFRYKGDYDPADLTRNLAHIGQPSQAPFDKNDPRNPEHLEAAIYHFTPAISDYTDQDQRLTYAMADLDDLNTMNPVVQDALKTSFNYWIKTAGVDGFRFDTGLYVEHEFWQAFLYGNEGGVPGIYETAKQTGRDDFYTFGEMWVNAVPMDDEGEKEALAYLGTPKNPEMDGVINFPLQQTMKSVFGQGQPTKHLSHRVQMMEQYFPEPTQRVNFLDNHDMPRYLRTGSKASFRQALTFMLSIPGVPVIYQGTEQAVLDSREDLFDQLDEETEDFKFLQALIELRKSTPSMRKSKIKILGDSEDVPGLFLYALEGEVETIYGLFNISEQPLFVAGIPLGNKSGTALEAKVLSSLQSGSDWSIIQDDGGNVSIDNALLLPNEAVLFSLVPTVVKKEVIEKKGLLISSTKNTNDQLFIEGKGLGVLEVIIDGDFENRMVFQAKEADWQMTVPIIKYGNGKHVFYLVESEEENRTVLQKGSFELSHETQLIAQKTDLKGDDHGATGDYQYPTADGFEGCMDIEEVKMFRTGHELQFDIKMVKPLSKVWNPANGFDHILFFVFIDFPKLEGGKDLPYIHAKMPRGFDWDFCATANGWNVGMYTPSGSSETSIGTTTAIKPEVVVLPQERTVRLLFPAQSFGNLDSFEGVRAYITTWDGEGEGALRPLRATAEGYHFGWGSNPAKEQSERVMDRVLMEE